MARLPCFAASVALALALASSRAHAQSACPVDGGMAPLPPNYGQLSDFFPSDGAHGVPTDGFIRLRYVGVAPDPSVVVVTNMITGLRETGVTHIVGSDVLWQDTLSFAASTMYQVSVADPSVGGDTFLFTTGVTPSQPGPPVFSGVDVASASFQREGAGDLCGDAEAVEVTLCWRPAENNGWPQSDVEYVVFETRGPGISGPVERARQRGQPSGSSCTNGTADEIARSFRIASANAASGLCFNVQALDAYGRPDGNNVETCVHPEVGNYFVGCDVAAPRTPAAAPVGRARACLTAAAFAALALGLVLRVRRGRRGG